MSDTELLDEFLTEPVQKKSPEKVIKEVKVTAQNIEKSVEQKARLLDIAQKNLVNIYKSENKVTVRVAPHYAKYFGRVMRVAINGISVAIKCDGKNVSLPESFAAEVMRRMNEMDKYDSRLSRMADVTSNYETSPGQLNFFG